MSASTYVLLFALYALCGWLVEALFRSLRQRRFVNAGFLVGPFVPTYGMGALITMAVNEHFASQPLAARVLYFALSLTALEYALGWLVERLFRIKLWDYSDNRLNLHGRICLKFSALWTLFALAFVVLIHPRTTVLVATVPLGLARTSALVVLGYFAVDLLVSALWLTSFRDKLAALYTEYVTVERADMGEVFASFGRLTRAFPHLNRLIQQQIYAGIKEKVGDAIERVGNHWHGQWDTVLPDSGEYDALVRDILEHPEFQRLATFRHHDASILEHAKKVSRYAYKICKVLHFDYRSAARGGLLHDFFLYDWRCHDVPDLPKEKFHGLAHPAIALGNAEKHFVLNDVERDIILRHMWPLTLTPPRYKESFVVTFADKAVSSQEAATLLAAKVREHITRS
ncbi:MAG: hypothetical protein AAB426_10620 [Myxococcota bacterium]